jgi:hypothetical protein
MELYERQGVTTRLEKKSVLSAFCVFLRSLWPIHSMSITGLPALS